ncbi:response regulator [Paraburkholderia sp. Ac-20342]|uniref:hybrid sensor histidine kinase/response regulator n=1 Tax=Paraburkholderia sp. Ac-20342 TaxID=2703889 RepID=UPI00197FF481|nr:ATP-binding protein [Paraburkholderia sp. Ac-20342]MBN3846955.1 response regulator [Paraburkholderia sp. Ac-20342]
MGSAARVVIDSNPSILTRLRRFQRRLLFGGGLISSLIALLILGLGVWSNLDTYVEAQRRAFTLEFDLVRAHGQQGLIDPARISGTPGIAMIVGRNGSIATRAGQSDVAEGAPSQQTLQRLASNAGAEPQEEYEDGLFLISRRLSDGQALVHTYDSRNLAAAASEDAFADLMITLPTLGMMWILLIALKFRVFRPLLEWSRRVYENEKLNQALIDTAPVGLGLISIDSGKVLVRNQLMAELARRIAPAEDALSDACLQQYSARVARNDVTWRQGIFNQDLQFETHDRTGLDLSVSMVRVRYLGKSVLVTAFTDVTAKRRLDQQLRKARQASDSANAAKSAFLAAMSHEIRTPLNAVLGNLELLSHSSLDAVQRDRLRTIRISSDGLLAIVDDVLDFSKIEAGELRLEEIEFDVLEVVSNAIRVFAPVARAKGLVLNAWLGEVTELPMTGDPTRFSQIISNLLSNAVKFTEVGEVALQLSIDSEQNMLTVDVRDTGIGMSPEQQSRLFRPFNQADSTINRRFGGTGLGLALTYRLTQAMGGTLSARSAPGDGSVFALSLPLSHGARVGSIPRFDGQHVVLLSACAAWRSHLERALLTWGLRVHAFADPAQVTVHALETADAVVLWGERSAWDADAENRVIEETTWVIDCVEDGPADPLAIGRLLRVSTIGLKGLADALRHKLQGATLAGTDLRHPVFARRLRVLVVEDYGVIRALLEDQLRMLGCDPVAVPDGSQALANLEKATFDVLLTDLTLPELDGYALAEQAHARWPTMPTIAASAHVTALERTRCRQSGISVVLSKPMALEDLAGALSEVTGERALHVEVHSRGTLRGHPIRGDLREIYGQACETSLGRIQQGRAAANIPMLLAELHALRGIPAVFGEYELSRFASQAEASIAAQGDLTAAGPLLDTIEEWLECAGGAGTEGIRSNAP